jgi:hypothetical protein
MRSSSIVLLFGAGLGALALCAACGGDDAAPGANGGTNAGGSAGSSMNEAGATDQPGGAGESTGGMSGGGSASGGTAMAGGSSSGGVTSGGMSAGGASVAGSGGNGLYLPCEAAADCKAFGGGKVCCAMGTMHFCTKPSGCSGDILP